MKNMHFRQKRRPFRRSAKQRQAYRPQRPTVTHLNMVGFLLTEKHKVIENALKRVKT